MYIFFLIAVDHILQGQVSFPQIYAQAFATPEMFGWQTELTQVMSDTYSVLPETLDNTIIF